MTSLVSGAEHVARPSAPALRVLHLTGSAVNDFLAELSLLYARDCLAATADPARYESHLAHVTPDGCWRFPTDLSREAIAAATPLGMTEALAHLGGLDLDVAVPQMFCLPGMTTYRALLDLLGLPYVGNTPDVMALAAHKARTKAVVVGAGVAVPRGELLRVGEQPTLAPPVVIKPVDADNSLGVTLVRDTSAYEPGLAAAFEHSAEVLVEDYVELGREVRCGIVEQDGKLVCLPLEEYAVDPETKPIRGYDDKISRGAGERDLRLVAKDATRAWILDPADPVTEAVWDAARRAHVALGCRHYSLFDFRVDAQGRPWFLEAGLYCSFAEQSVVAVMARAAGIPLPELFASSILQAMGGRRTSG